MTEKAFKCGDVVRLTAGGPPMTVHHYDVAGGVRCIWFDGADLKGDSFDQGALSRVPSPPAEEQT